MIASEQKIDVVVNGKHVVVARDISIVALLDQLQVNDAAIAVELNSEIQSRNLFGTTKLRNGDSLEIVSLAGGG